MNDRKQTDYSILFAALEALMAANLPQMELYCEIGRLVCGRPGARYKKRGYDYRNMMLIAVTARLRAAEQVI